MARVRSLCFASGTFVRVLARFGQRDWLAIRHVIMLDAFAGQSSRLVAAARLLLLHQPIEAHSSSLHLADGGYVGCCGDGHGDDGQSAGLHNVEKTPRAQTTTSSDPMKTGPAGLGNAEKTPRDQTMTTDPTGVSYTMASVWHLSYLTDSRPELARGNLAYHCPWDNEDSCTSAQDIVHWEAEMIHVAHQDTIRAAEQELLLEAERRLKKVQTIRQGDNKKKALARQHVGRAAGQKSPMKSLKIVPVDRVLSSGGVGPAVAIWAVSASFIVIILAILLTDQIGNNLAFADWRQQHSGRTGIGGEVDVTDLLAALGDFGDYTYVSCFVDNCVDRDRIRGKPAPMEEAALISSNWVLTMFLRNMYCCFTVTYWIILARHVAKDQIYASRKIALLLVSVVMVPVHAKLVFPTGIRHDSLSGVGQSGLASSYDIDPDDIGTGVVNCQGSWGEWDACSARCGGGTRTRTYRISVGAANGGEICEASDGEVELKTCNSDACPAPQNVPGGSEWQERELVPVVADELQLVANIGAAGAPRRLQDAAQRACSGEFGNGRVGLTDSICEMYVVWGYLCDTLVGRQSYCGTYCGACTPDWQIADVNSTVCNAWQIRTHEDGWGGAVIRVEDDAETLLIDGLAYADEHHFSAHVAPGVVDVCLGPSQCYNVTVNGSATARWSVHDAQGVMVVQGSAPFSQQICHCGHNGGDKCVDCTTVAARRWLSMAASCTMASVLQIAAATSCQRAAGTVQRPYRVNAALWVQNGTVRMEARALYVRPEALIMTRTQEPGV